MQLNDVARQGDLVDVELDALADAAAALPAAAEADSPPSAVPAKPKKRSTIQIKADALLKLKAKLDQLGTPYLLRQIVNGDSAPTGALFVTIPGTYSAWQLQSTQGFDSSTTPVFDMCSSE